MSQYVHSLHHGPPRHDLVINDNNFISTIVFPCYYRERILVVCGTWNSSTAVPLKISTARLQNANIQGRSQDFRKGGAENAHIVHENFEPEATPNN